MVFLVCGGAGYIGSHMAKTLVRRGHDVVIFDNLSTGKLEHALWGELHIGDICNSEDLDTLFHKYHFDCVMHFAANSIVGESVLEPELYYHNNVAGTLNLLECMHRFGVNKFIFSSSAAIFGNPETEFICETHVKKPVNPYGRTKLMIEEMLQDFSRAYQINAVSLRYFNAAGADPDAETGEDHAPETHLIPNIIKSVVDEHCEALQLFGNDYDTIDGTCVRDYVHVMDLCAAHLKAFEFLPEHNGAFAFNLGNGEGFSVLQVIKAVEEVTGKSALYQICGRRDGDPARLVADSTFAREALAWSPEYEDISAMIQTAWKWHSKKSHNG